MARSVLALSAIVAWSIVFLALLPTGTFCYSTPRHRRTPRNAVVIFEHDLRSKRHVPEGILNPYSVLGFLSFATFIFSVVYNRHKGMKPPPSSTGPSGPSGPPMRTKFELDPQEDVTYIMKVDPANILKKVSKKKKKRQGSSLTSSKEVEEEYFNDDDYNYEDDSFEMEALEPNRNRSPDQGNQVAGNIKGTDHRPPPFQK